MMQLKLILACDVPAFCAVSAPLLLNGPVSDVMPHLHAVEAYQLGYFVCAALRGLDVVTEPRHAQRAAAIYDDRLSVERRTRVKHMIVVARIGVNQRQPC